MDANGARFWMLAERSHWRPEAPAAVEYDARRRLLRLASRRRAPEAPLDMAAAQSALERVPATTDTVGTYARWDTTRREVVAGGARPGEVAIWAAPPDETPTDLAMGFDDVLYIASGGRVTWLDRRGRFAPVAVSHPAFTAWRLAADPGGGAWALDRTRALLARVEGLPLPERPAPQAAPDAVRACEENLDPPRLTPYEDARLPAGEMPVALAVSPGGRLAVLAWTAEGPARLRLLGADARLGPPIDLDGARHPFSLAWLAEDRVAVLVAGLAETLAYEVDAGPAQPLGELHPLRDHDGGPFLHGLALPPRYPTTDGSAPLYRLSLPSLAERGAAGGAAPFDAERPGTVWHRLYLEALMPPGTQVTVWLAATEEPEPPAPADWFPHRFGGPAEAPPGVPRGARLPTPSELPFHGGMLPEGCDDAHAGCWTVLVQRAGRRVRTLAGRFLWVRVELAGEGRRTPEVAALRAWAPRFSYLDRYLPEAYRETTFAPEADEPGPATPPDFMQRFLGLFESVLTPLEDRIAAAHLLTDARTVPAGALDWLGGWVGLAFDGAVPVERRRALLEAAPALWRARGTARGLARVLELATGGAVSGGEIVVVEDWRLRRTFATILGADLADEDDPLTAGLAVTGNAFVGDTLLLGDERRHEFLALFAADLPAGEQEQAGLQAFLDGLAFRVTVLVHDAVEPQDLGLIRRLVERETPAHLAARVVPATLPFLVGLAALVGVDTYLGPRPRPGRARVQVSRLGAGDRVVRLAALDPRVEGAPGGWTPGPRPVADAGPDLDVERGASFALDAGGSRAAPGHAIERYVWRMQT